jgi:hypothetical protein
VVDLKFGNIKNMNVIDWIKEKLIPPYKPNQKEELILDIVQKLCDQSDTDIRMAPITGRYYIVNKRLQYWVRLSEDAVSITNHKFTFSNYSPQVFQTHLIKIVQNVIESHRNDFETTVFQNEVELLENISNNIKSE